MSHGFLEGKVLTTNDRATVVAMDPVSAIGLAGSVIAIIDVAAKSISALRALQQRWKAADLTISLLISQLTTLKAALGQIEEWISASLNAIHHYQLIMDLGASLESCETLLLFIHGQLTDLDWNDSNVLSFESKIKAVLQDKTVKECATHLANQSTALNLLLTALNCRSLSEQNNLLQAKENRRVLDQVEEDSSSLFCLRDPASFRNSITATTERSSLLDISFDFDHKLTATKVYHRQWRPLIRGALRRGRKAKNGSVNSQEAMDVKIWVPGQSRSGVSMLPKVMSILCEHNYEPELRRSYIYQVVLDTLDAILDKMSELSKPMDHDVIAAYVELLMFQHTPMSIEKLPQWLQQAIVNLWDDLYVRKCYHDSVESTAHPSATYFLNSVARIVSADYVPSFEDTAMSLVSRTLRSDVLALPVRVSSRSYNFVSSTRQEASLSNWADDFEALEAILFIADLATCNTDFTNGGLVDEFDTTLQIFRRVCKFPWLAEKDIILVFLNIDKFSLNAHAPSRKQKEDQAKFTVDIVKEFVSLNEDESREIHVIFAENDERAKNLESFEGAVQRILNQKELTARFLRNV